MAICMDALYTASERVCVCVCVRACVRLLSLSLSDEQCEV
jgi:hypothetical protein